MKMKKKSNLVVVFHDLNTGLNSFKIWWMLAWQDIKKRYRRSTLGPFWITLSTIIMVGLMGPIYSLLFNINFQDYLSYLAISFIIWNFISLTINESCHAFIESEEFIKQLNLPLSIYLIKIIVRNILIFLHNFTIIVFIWVFFSFPGIESIIIFLFCFLLLIFNLFNLGLILAILCTRYRDIPLIVNNLIFACFFLTPILWKKEMLGERAFFADYNPIFIVIESVRSPLMGESPTFNIISLNLIFSIVFFFLSILIFTKYRSRISYWI